MKATSFQAVVRVGWSAEHELERALHAMELAQPPLLRLALEWKEERLSAFLDFDGLSGFMRHRSQLESLTTVLGGQLIELDELGDEQRDALIESARGLRSHTEVVSAFRAARTSAPTLTLNCRSESELLAAWARHVGEGALWVPGQFNGGSVALTIVVGDHLMPDNRAVRVQGFEPMPGPPGAWLEIVPGAELATVLSRATSEAQRPPRRAKVLVVDDEPIWRSTLVRVLKGMDVDIILANDGREGLTKLIDGYFELDLVILDLHMPHLDGRGLIERVRRLGGDTGLKIFLFSATSREELAALAEPGFATRVFSKLDEIHVLEAAIAQELAEQRALLAA